MDVKLIPGDFRGRAYTAGMFNGLIYLVDPIAGSATPAFDTSPQGGMPQILQVTRDGSRLLTGLFQSGRILMLDTTNRSKLRQVAALDLGAGAGPHNIMLTDDDTRLIVTDYFLDRRRLPVRESGQGPARRRPQGPRPQGDAAQPQARHPVQPRLQHRVSHRSGASPRDRGPVAGLNRRSVRCHFKTRHRRIGLSPSLRSPFNSRAGGGLG